MPRAGALLAHTLVALDVCGINAFWNGQPERNAMGTPTRSHSKYASGVIRSA